MNKYLFFFLIFITTNAFSNHHILVLGDSLTEGFGVEVSKSFPAVLEKKLNQDANIKVKIFNGGISGSTSASGLSRLKWQLKNKIDILMLELGANDGLRGFDITETEKNLDEIISFAKSKNVKVWLLGLYMPPNYGKKYTTDFMKMYERLSKRNKIPLFPFLLQNIAGKNEYNLSDGIHPNEKGHELIANSLVDFVKKNLNENKIK